MRAFLQKLALECRKTQYYLCLVGLTAALCGCAAGNGAQSAPAPAVSQPSGDASSEAPDEALLVDPILYEAGGYTVALPQDWEGKVLVDVEQNLENGMITVYEKASFEQCRDDWGEESEAGFLFSLVRYDQIQFEHYLSAGAGGITVFARDKNDYCMERFPTDVQYYRSGADPLYEGEDWSDWCTMVEQVEDVKRDFIARNGLQEYDGSEYYDREFTYAGEHRYMLFYPYYDEPDTARENGFTWEEAGWTLILSQPVKQGEGGVWCVERCFHDSVTQWFYSFPTESGMAAADYYPMLQSRADTGEETTHLTPEGAARAWAENAYQEHVILFSPQSFQVLNDVPAGEPHKYAQKLLMQPGRFGWVSDGELIHTGDCPDGASGGLYRSLTQTPWAVPEGVSVDEGNLVYYETESGDRLEIYNSGIVMITQEGDTRIYQPMWNNDNGEVYNEAVLWVTSLEPQSE